MLVSLIGGSVRVRPGAGNLPVGCPPAGEDAAPLSSAAFRAQGTGSDSELVARFRTCPRNRNGGRGEWIRPSTAWSCAAGLEMEPDQALALIALVGVGLAAVLFLWRGELWLSILGLILGGGGALAVFLVLQNRYRRQLSEQLPDAFYLLARSLRAGLSLEQAIALTGEQGAKPLADEFRRCAAQLRLGLAIPAALELVAKRIQMLDFNVFVTHGGAALHDGRQPGRAAGSAGGQRPRPQSFPRLFPHGDGLEPRHRDLHRHHVAAACCCIYAIFPPDHMRAFFESSTGWTADGRGRRAFRSSALSGCIGCCEWSIDGVNRYAARRRILRQREAD